MGRKRKRQSMSGIFRGYFEAHPEWLQIKKNDAVLAQFAADHPNIKIDRRVKQAMANAKNVARKGGYKGTKGKRRKVAAMRAAIVGASGGPLGGFQLLEDHIDDCLAMAKQVSAGRIDDVVKHLHRARNILVLAIET